MQKTVTKALMVTFYDFAIPKGLSFRDTEESEFFGVLVFEF